MTAIGTPVPVFNGLDGLPLDNGSIYVGEAGQDAREYPIAAYRDAALTQAWAQPIHTVAGFPSYQGAPSRIFIAENSCTVTVMDQRGQIVLNNLQGDWYVTASALAADTGAAMIGTSTSGTNVQEALDARPTSATLAASGGSALVGFLQAGTGAVAGTLQGEGRRVVYVEQYGASPGASAATNSAAFNLARNYLATSSDYRGGVIRIGRGNFALNEAWDFTPYVTGQVFNITIEGEGPLATNLDFTACSAGVNGITAIGQGVSFHLKNLSINGARNYGVLLKGGSVGTTNYLFFASLENVRVQGSVADGVYSENSYMVEMRQVWSKDNTGAGLNFQGFHTAINATACWATDNDDAGWRINGAIYFNLLSCGSDRNLYGYRLTNVTGTVSGCGAESCVREGFAVETATSYNTGLPTDALGVYLTMIGCYAVSNSTAGVNAYANLLSCLTANSLAISVTMIGCVSRQGTSTAHALALNAASGAVDIWGYTTMGTNADSTNVNTGGTIH